MVPGAGRRWMKFPLITLLLFLLIIPGGVYHGVTAGDDTYERLKIFTEVLSLIQSNYVENVDPKDLVYGGIRGMLESLDPHSSFMPPEVFKEMQVETQGSFGGLGIEITVKDHQLTVVAPIEGTPADRAGIQPGDRIIKIDGQPTKDMTLMEAVRKMRGPRGTQVTLTIGRDEKGVFDLTLTREIIEIKSVRSQDLGDGIGYVRLISFQERTARDLQNALERLRKNGMNALVLDLRNNPGGLLNQAVQVSELFLDKGQLIVYTQGRAKDQNLRFVAEGRNGLPKFPMVVLVNGGSASASEIVAGALQDWKRAVVLGTKTFGKGSVQTVIPLSDGSGLRLTTARYFTPKGRSIHGSGIVPDIVVELPQPEKVAKAPEREEPSTTPPRERKISEEEDSSIQIGRKNLVDLKSDLQLQRAIEILKASRILEGRTTAAETPGS